MDRISLRPTRDDDLPHLGGGDSEFDDFGQSSTPTLVGADLDERGRMCIVGPDDLPLGEVSWVWWQWGPNRQSRCPMVGLWVQPTARGRGVGTAALRELVDLLFRHTTTNRVEAHTDVANVAARRALEGAGFAREGIVRGAQWRDGAYHDGHLYSVLRAEWAAPG